MRRSISCRWAAGYLELESDIDHRRREITYARANYLVKRWNQENAQANVFVWGGAGQAYVSETQQPRVRVECGRAVRLRDPPRLLHR